MAAIGDCLLVCLRVPKSGSASLMSGLEACFVQRRIFYLPDTLDLDGTLSRFQRLRFRRARAQNLFRHYRSFGIRAAFECIAREAAAGDLIMGGHIDRQTAQVGIARPLKLIALLRDPVARCASEYAYLRRGYYRKSALNRFDAGVLHRQAGRSDFDGFLDFLDERRDLYGNIASRYFGWDGGDLADFFSQHVFHCGALEDTRGFARALSEKLGRPFALPHENRAPEEPAGAVSTAQRAKIERVYKRDMKLHEWVRSHG